MSLRMQEVRRRLTQQLNSLKLSFLNKNAGELSFSPAATVFVPTLASDSDVTSVEISGSSSSSSQEVEQEPVELKPRLATVGQVITGRLNIHRPKDGTPPKYYINWCNRSRDNLLMPSEEMRKCFGSLRALKVGMYFKVTVSVVPEDRTLHPTGVNPVNVPAPKQNRRERRAQYIKKLRDRQRKASQQGRPYNRRQRRN